MWVHPKKPTERERERERIRIGLVYNDALCGSYIFATAGIVDRSTEVKYRGKESALYDRRAGSGAEEVCATYMLLHFSTMLSYIKELYIKTCGLVQEAPKDENDMDVMADVLGFNFIFSIKT